MKSLNFHKMTIAIFSLGFSIPELLIVLFIVAILISFSLPAYQSLRIKSEGQMLSSQVLQAIYLSRNISQTRHQVVVMCKSLDQLTCGGNWMDGYIIIADDHVVYRFQNFIHKGSLNWRARGHEQDLKFYPSGSTHQENGTFWYCSEKDKNPIWAIVLNKKAYPQLKKPDKKGEIMVGHQTLVC